MEILIVISFFCLWGIIAYYYRCGKCDGIAEANRAAIECWTWVRTEEGLTCRHNSEEKKLPAGILSVVINEGHRNLKLWIADTAWLERFFGSPPLVYIGKSNAEFARLRIVPEGQVPDDLKNETMNAIVENEIKFLPALYTAIAENPDRALLNRFCEVYNQILEDSGRPDAWKFYTDPSLLPLIGIDADELYGDDEEDYSDWFDDDEY